MRLEDNLRAGMPRFVRLAGVSHGHLARTTRTYLGCSPVEFLARARVDLAASLLETTAEPVGRIAQRCGFSSQAYFARVFCQVRGSSPRAYRSAVRRRVVP
jgi:transcriptional regulator GlxA family with amidase domain